MAKSSSKMQEVKTQKGVSKGQKKVAAIAKSSGNKGKK